MIDTLAMSSRLLWAQNRTDLSPIHPLAIALGRLALAPAGRHLRTHPGLRHHHVSTGFR